MSTHPATNIFYKVPIEIWNQVFLLACTDGGYTGCSLSLVSRRCYALSQPARYHSVVIQQAGKLVEFAATLRGLVARYTTGKESSGQVRFTTTLPLPSSIPKIRHLFIGLGDLFFELGGEVKDRDDGDYIYPGPIGSSPRWCWEPPESDDDSDDVRNLTGPELTRAELSEDLNWFKSEEGKPRRSLIPEETVAPLHQEYETPEHQCLSFLQEVLTSPCCLHTLESLSIFINFRHPVDLNNLLPAYPTLKRLAIHSEGPISWGDFITPFPSATVSPAASPRSFNAPTPPPTPPASEVLSDTEPDTILYPSLQTFRISGVWFGPGFCRNTYIDSLLSFLQVHTPNLQRMRAPMSDLHRAQFMTKIVSATHTRFPPALYDAIIDIRNLTSHNITLTPRYIPDLARVPWARDAPVNALHPRISLVEPEDVQDADAWLGGWMNEINGSGDDKKIWWNVDRRPNTRCRYFGRLGKWMLSMTVDDE